MVKVCGITRREDALVAVESGATAIGFIFYPQSPRYITPERAAEIGEGLTVWKVGIFVDPDLKDMATIAQVARLDVVQIYHKQSWRIQDLLPKHPRSWISERVTEKTSMNLEFWWKRAEAVLLDGQKNGSSFDWKLARTSKGKVIVAGGLDASNVAEAIRIARPWGVDASSKLETAPGIKDHEKVKAFVAAALAAGKEYAC